MDQFAWEKIPLVLQYLEIENISNKKKNIYVGTSPRDAAPVEVIVCDGDVLDLLVATLQEAVVADVGEDVPLDHHLGAVGDQEARHGGVGDLAVGHRHV